MRGLGKNLAESGVPETTSSNGAVTLGDIVDRLPVLEVSCSRSGRYGRLSVARLIEHERAGYSRAEYRVLNSRCPRYKLLFDPSGRRGMRWTMLLGAALLLGLGGCVSKLANQSCQDRGFSPGTGLYGSCYSAAAPAIVETYEASILRASLPWAYATPLDR
jgi:hypothetical protein